MNKLTDKDLQQVSGGSMEESLKKLQEGMKINNSNSKDEYQISDKIREMIRNGINPYQEKEIP